MFGLSGPAMGTPAGFVQVAVQTGLEPDIRGNDTFDANGLLSESVGDSSGTFAEGFIFVQPGGGPLELHAVATAVNAEAAAAFVIWGSSFSLRPEDILTVLIGKSFIVIEVGIDGTLVAPGTGKAFFEIANRTIGSDSIECEVTLAATGHQACLVLVPFEFAPNVPLNDFPFHFSLEAIAGAVSGGGRAVADFRNTASITRVSVLDRDKHFLQDITVVDEAGLRLGGETAAVAEPGTLILLVAGLGALTAVTRRRPRQRAGRSASVSRSCRIGSKA